MYTVLVAPLGKRDSIGTFIQRSLEKLILAYWQKTHEVRIEKGNWPK
jgi:predicted HAD superfamily phosphohydrolase YqeG